MLCPIMKQCRPCSEVGLVLEIIIHGLDTGVIGFESGVGLENASATLVQSVNGADILK